LFSSASEYSKTSQEIWTGATASGLSLYLSFLMATEHLRPLHPPNTPTHQQRAKHEKHNSAG
jgi:hypothetical protein